MKSGQYHKKCFTCSECHRPLDYSSANDSPRNEILCSPCYKRNYGPSSLPQELNSRYKTDTIKAPDGDGCPKCSGAVFDAEKVVASNGKIYHKSCAKCSHCSTVLTSLNLSSDKDGTIFCQGCYCRKYGGASYRAVGTSAWVDGSQHRAQLNNQDLSHLKPVIDGDEGCLRCGGAVFEAEKVIISNKLVFHKSCFSCKGCKGNLDVSKVCIGPEKEVYCRNCYKSLLNLDHHNLYIATDSIKADDKTGCPECGGRVFEAEKIVTKSSWYHKTCFACSKCKHKLDIGNYVEVGPLQVFCKTCYAREYCSNEKHKFGDKTGVKADEGDKSGCQRCGDKVFSVDKVLGRTGVYHKQCLSCGDCGSKLNVTNFSCGSDGDMYCRQCYAVRLVVTIE